MKKLLKMSFAFFLSGVLSVVILFFWASSANLDATSYSIVVTNNFENVKNIDSIFSIVSYNIGYLSGMTNNRPVAKPRELFNVNLQKVLKEMKAVNPDMIGLQ